MDSAEKRELIEKLAREIVGTWDMDTLIEYAVARVFDYYEGSSDEDLYDLWNSLFDEGGIMNREDTLTGLVLNEDPPSYTKLIYRKKYIAENQRFSEGWKEKTIYVHGNVNDACRLIHAWDNYRHKLGLKRGIGWHFEVVSTAPVS